MPGGKDGTIAVAELSPAGPVVKAPMAKPEDTAVVEEIVPQTTVVSEAAPKLNGSIPSVVVEAPPNELPVYEPNQTIIETTPTKEPEVPADDDNHDDDEDETKPRVSLEDQIKDLEEQIERKISFTESNHVDKELESPVTETMNAETVNHVENKPDTPYENDLKPDTHIVPEPNKSSGISCCKIFMVTFFFIFLTLVVTALVIYNSTSNDSTISMLRDHLQFVNPVRDYISDKVQLLRSKM